MQQQSQLTQCPVTPDTKGGPNASWEATKSGEGAASALEALKKMETNRNQLQPQPGDERPAG
jgi:hypothetical protein